MRPSNTPTVAVIIPNQSRLTELGEALQSVAGQQFQGSIAVYLVHEPRNEVGTLLREWTGLITALPHHSASSPSPIAARRNIGLKNCAEDYVAFLDDDDLWHPEKLRIQIRAMQESGAIACWTGWHNFRSSNELSWERTPLSAYRVLSSYDLLRSGRTVTSSMLVRGPVARSLMLDERREWSGLDDYDFKLRLAKEGDTIIVAQKLTALRINPNSGSRVRPTLHFARALGVFLNWVHKEGWNQASLRAFFVRWGVTALFPQGGADPEAVRELASAIKGRLPALIERLVFWSIVKAWRSKVVVPKVRSLLPTHLVE